MVAIEGVGWHPGTRQVSSSRTPAARGFAVPSSLPDTAQAEKAAAPEAVPLTSMLTLQELGSEASEDREARRHAQDMLAELAALQRALLAGENNMGALQRLTELAAAVPRAADRRLAAMVSAIMVRVRVELARRQM